MFVLAMSISNHKGKLNYPIQIPPQLPQKKFNLNTSAISTKKKRDTRKTTPPVEEPQYLSGPFLAFRSTIGVIRSSGMAESSTGCWFVAGISAINAFSRPSSNLSGVLSI